MRSAIHLTISFFLVGCASIVGADFGGYGSADDKPAPTTEPPSDESGPGGDGGVRSSTSSTSSSTGGGTSSTSSSSSGGSSSGASSGSTSTSSSSGTTSRTCQGTPTACVDIPYDQTSVCQAQAGCDATAGACTNDDACAAAKTNTACQQTPGCATDFATSTCKRVAGYCTGKTKSTCEAKAGCRMYGGCGGTAIPCSAATFEAACLGQMGCAWR